MERRFSGPRKHPGGFNRGFRQGFRPREMHKAVCADCKQECEVPFKPNEGKPVYCRDCFQKRKETA
ncbi:MAG: CxxC-x17-CxxC domain-containing protein [Candidatus Pacearchaeota archaeon]